MPKRRYKRDSKGRFAKTGSASRRKRATGTPMGKTVLLMHRTSPKAADAIVKQGFKVTHKNTPISNLKGDYVFGSLPGEAANWSGYGEAVVGVKVSRKKVKKDVLPGALKVAVSDLKGKKVKRYKAPKRRTISTANDFSALFE